MTKLKKQLSSQIYDYINNIKVGDTIYINWSKTINGIDKVVDIQYGTRTDKRSFAYKQYSCLVITTDKFTIEVPSDAKLPTYNGKFVFRKVPKSGQYSLLGSTVPDMEPLWNHRCFIENINRSVKLEKFNDPIKYYSDSKTKDYETSNLVSKYSKIHKVRIKTSTYGQVFFVDKLIEFNYDPNNFIIPYKFSNILGTFEVPNDVKKIGKRCFSHFKYLDNIILPHMVVLKSGALIGTDFIPDVGPIFNRKLGSYKCDRLSIFNNMHRCVFDMSLYSKGSSIRLTDCYINPKLLRVGDIVKIPVNKFITHIGNYQHGRLMNVVNYEYMVLLDKTDDRLIFNESSWIIDKDLLRYYYG